jgi:glycosyltransferase involved in cell wall biosynthesis
MNKGIIIYIGFYSLPDKDAAAHRVMNNAKIFRKLGYEVIFIDEQIEYSYDDVWDSERKIDGFTVFSLKRPDNIVTFVGKMVNINMITPIIDNYKEVKMIIAYNYPAIALDKVRRKYKGRINVCSDCSEWYSGKAYKFPLSILSEMDTFYRMRIVNKKLDGIICISNYLYSYYKSKTLVVNIPPLVDINDEIWYQEKYMYETDKINLVYAGNPGRCKDLVKPIIEAVNNSKMSSKLVLRIVGITKEQYLKQNHNNIISIDKENIIFMGRVSHAENVRVVGSSDGLIFIREKNRMSMAGFSTKFVEAVTSDTAVVTTDTSDMREYIGHIGKGAIINDIEELYKLLSDSKKLEIILDKKNENRKNRLNPSDTFDYRGYIQRMSVFVENVLAR